MLFFILLVYFTMSLNLVSKINNLHIMWRFFCAENFCYRDNGLDRQRFFSNAP